MRYSAVAVFAVDAAANYTATAAAVTVAVSVVHRCC